MGKKFLNDFRIIEVMIALALMIFLNAILGCSKEGVCIATTGEIISQARNINSFDSLYVYDNVNVILQNGLDISVIVEAGQNIINGIKLFIMTLSMP